MTVTSTTARLGFATLALQALCLMAAVGVYLVEHFAPGAMTAELAGRVLQTVGSISIGGGLGGGVGAASHGARHIGTAAPTSAMLFEAPDEP